ncbi:hypothetical protein M0208_11340 [Sphingomonas sp. SUN019]|uniref:hypothetical protein n=1 Tax=Sphingomonas sp. SUN019 TaxID=2937788 RepID=UPI002164BE49|nr:hypothetical protein [Sphingomonas sp. SUN019]UVO51082.1 hypothetical protein M0208_11340 [Sphingomonas sp. SUN019]
MQFFARLSPFRAIRDLRFFLHQRQPHELGFLALAIVVTGVILIGFAKDSHIEKTYRPNIIYVQQWRLDRTDEQIRAQQKVDQAKRDIEDAALEKQRAERQATFKRIDDKLNRWGL